MIQGVLALVVSSIITGIVPTLQKQIVAEGLPIFSMMFFNCTTVELGSFLISRFRGHSLRIERKQLIQALLMGPAGTFLITAMLNYAYQYMPVGTAQMIHYFYPTVTCIIMGTIFRQGFSKLQLTAVALSLGGMFMLAGKSGEIAPMGIVLAFGSAVIYGGYMVANEKGSINELPLEVKMFYTSLPSLLIIGTLAPATGNFVLPHSPKIWLLVLFCSGIGGLLGSFLLLFGIKKLGASTASFLSMINPIVSVVVSTIWFHDPVTVGIVAGSVLVLTSTFLTTVDSARKEKKAQVQETSN